MTFYEEEVGLVSAFRVSSPNGGYRSLAVPSDSSSRESM